MMGSLRLASSVYCQTIIANSSRFNFVTLISVKTISYWLFLNNWSPRSPSFAKSYIIPTFLSHIVSNITFTSLSSITKALLPLNEEFILFILDESLSRSTLPVASSLGMPKEKVEP